MNGQKKGLIIAGVILAILIIAAFMLFGKKKDAEGNSTTEVITTETDNGSYQDGAEEKDSEAATNEKSDGENDSGVATYEQNAGEKVPGNDSDENNKKGKASEATMLENEGEIEIIIPDEMGDGGF